MLFNSVEFVFAFLPTVVVVYYLLHGMRHTVAARVWLIISSFVFYGYWDIRYCALLAMSIFVNYAIGGCLSNARWRESVWRKSILTGGLIFNLGLLGYYKYTDFFITNINSLTNADIPLFHYVLPLGISFFTFQQITYLVDSYKHIVEEHSFLSYAIFVSFFPQLIAGPIVHHSEMMLQFEKNKSTKINYSNISTGTVIFIIGLFKKVVIADTFAVWANIGFDKAEMLNFVEGWITSLSYTFQLYFDFSGYTDMALGAALLFNIKLPQNFNSPYKAVTIQDFWRRWHMTLGRLMKDYLYLPLGGNRRGDLLTIRNILITFLLGGLWHGAGWMFLIWGLLHGMALVCYQLWRRYGFRLHKFIAWFITFQFINITWVFFRANTWYDAKVVIAGMVGYNGITVPLPFEKYLSILPHNLVNIVYSSNITGNIRGFLKIENNNSVAKLDLISTISQVHISSAVMPLLFIILALIAVSIFSNTGEIMEKFAPSGPYLAFVSLLFSIYFVFEIYLNVTNEFIYFNF